MKTARQTVRDLQTASRATRATATKEKRINTDCRRSKLEKWGFKTCSDARLEALLLAAELFRDEMSQHSRPRWLSILGDSGTGKTHIARRVFQSWLDGPIRQQPMSHRGSDGTVQRSFTIARRPQAIFRRWQTISREVYAGNHSIVDDLFDVELLVIDDLLSAHDPRGFLSSIASDLAERRLGKWTIFTSNFLLDQIAKKETRVASRMLRSGNEVIQLDNIADFNLRKDR